MRVGIGGAPQRAQGGSAATAHLLQFDSVQGRWRADIAAEGESTIRIDDRKLSFSSHATAAEIPWGDAGVCVLLECTGKFLTPETLQGHLDRGAKRVVAAAPVKAGDVRNVVFGINHRLHDPAKNRIVTAASCTPKCLAPTTTGSVTAIALNYPELKGKLNGHAVRATTSAAGWPHATASSATHALGRFVGTLLSGLLYQWGGLLLSLIGSAAMLKVCWLVTMALPVQRQLAVAPAARF
jgi:glyceraldehyde-3-phosphate dehydrogenase/erythrose-4-phosphate dehydrogenase